MRGLDPLKAILVVLSGGDRPGGLILSASPKAKELLGVSNVTRRSEVPYHPNLIFAPPRMKEYIAINLKILETITTYVPPEDVHVYSIDEVFVKYDHVKHLYHEANVVLFAKSIMLKIKEATGIQTAIGIGDNMLLAKLALDNEAKTTPHFIAEWRYEDVENKVWGIKKMTDFWGISHRTEKRLNNRGIHTIAELANYDPHRLKETMGMIGTQLHAHANGIDRSQIHEFYQPKEKSLSNSQILLKDYDDLRDIQVIIREMGDLLASRLRHIHAKTSCISLFIGYSKIESETGFSRQLKIPETNNTNMIVNTLIQIFEQHYHAGIYVRQIGVGASHLSYHTNIQLDLFEDAEQQIKQEKLHFLKDKIREKYGFQALIHASSLLENATAISRSTKIGGH